MDGLTLRAEDLGALTPEVLERVAQGEAVEITWGGAVVAKVVAPAALPDAEAKRPDRAGLAERFRALRAEANRLGLGLTHEQIREMRDDLHG
jgi:antitoxin (DNA-binding transcriptional repressor) of toxin-antitoxin stability system